MDTGFRYSKLLDLIAKANDPGQGHVTIRFGGTSVWKALASSESRGFSVKLWRKTPWKFLAQHARRLNLSRHWKSNFFVLGEKLIKVPFKVQYM